MILFKEVAALQKKLEYYVTLGKTISFVPTMGALHFGHVSLIQIAKKENAIIVASIFVNPTQFNNTTDFEKYPNTISSDVVLLEKEGCDILFLPSVKEIYPNGTKKLNKFDLGFIETVYDGAFRPGHFQGVCNVVQRLFEIVKPNNAYFGLKDYQQCMVISKLVQLMGWQNRLQLHFCETQREADGLAMSSRNMRLQSQDKVIAPTIYQTLLYVKEHIKQGDVSALLIKVKHFLTEKGFKNDYVDIADAYTLEPIIHWDGKQKIVCLVAVFLNEVRLIDNMVLN